MMLVTVIGARGFVGSAFARHFASQPGVSLRQVTRENYAQFAGTGCDLVVDASGSSTKFVAEKDPLADFDLSVVHRLQTLRDFPAECHLHISSVDVYDDLAASAATTETAAIDPARQSHYGFHKLLAEQCVRHHARRWLILRLAGMVGTGLRKNPVFDILSGRPIFIHPDSEYQFMRTDEVAAIAMQLYGGGLSNQIFNVCGDGLISPREIAAIAGVELQVSPGSAGSSPRIVNANIGKLKALFPVTQTRECVANFVRGGWNA